MKKAVLFVFILCMCFAAFGASFAETAATEAPETETPAAEMSAENLYLTGLIARNTGDYGKAMPLIKN